MRISIGIVVELIEEPWPLEGALRKALGCTTKPVELARGGLGDRQSLIFLIIFFKFLMF